MMGILSDLIERGRRRDLDGGTVLDTMTKSQIADVVGYAGAIDVSAALQAAVDAAVVARRPVRVPAGRYRIASTVQVPVAVPMIFDPGAILLKAADVPLVEVSDGWSWVGASVVGIAMASTPLQDNQVDVGTEGTTATYGAVLTLAAPVTVAKGDILKIYSDDVQIGARPSGTNRARKGEFVMVGAASTGSTITLCRPLWDTYATNIRVAKLRRSGSFIWDGFAQLDYDRTVPGADVWKTAYLHFRACSFVAKDLRSEASSWPVVRAFSCYDFRVDNLTNNMGRNDGSHDQFGYGVDVRNSQYGIVSNLMTLNTRHGMTTNPDEVAAGGGTPDNYGKTRDVTQAGGKAEHCSNASADSHEDSESNSYVNVTVVGTYPGGRSNGTAYTDRGAYNKFLNVSSSLTRVGMWVTGYKGTLIDGAEIRRCSHSALRIEQNGIAAPYDQEGLVIRNSLFEVEGTEAIAAMCAYGADSTHYIDLTLENVILRMLGPISASKVLDLYNLRMRFSNLLIDLREATFTAPMATIFSLIGTGGCNLVGDGLRILAGANQVNALVTSPAAATHRGRVRVRYEGDNDFSAGAGMWNGNPFNITNNGSFMVSGEKVLPAGTKRSRFVAQTASANFQLGIAQSCDDEIYIDIAGANGAVTGTDWADVLPPGTPVTINNGSNGAVTWAVPALVLAAGERARLVRTESGVAANKWKRVG